MPGTHFARWVIIEDVVYQGGRQRRDNLKASRLLFTSNFDGPLDAYLEALRTELADDADAVWGHCAGYPGRADAPAFAAYFRDHQVESALFFGAYGDQTVAEVHANLARRTQLIEFAMAAPGPRAGRAAGALPGGVHGVTEPLELASIQGFVVRGYRLPSPATCSCASTTPRAPARCWPRSTPDVLTADAVGDEAGVGASTSPSPTPGSRRSASPARRSPASRTSSAPGWRRAPSCSATSARAPRSTGRRPSAVARSTCW